MPLLRYFIFVGGALLALLFVVDFALPRDPAAQTLAAATSDAPVIRIRSDRKLPERVVLDTAQPTIAPPAVQAAAIVASPQPAHAGASDASAKAQVSESFAQVAANAPKSAAKKAEARPHRKIARSRPATPYPPYYYGRPMLMAQQPHFGLFNMTW